jgi:hypothetical protein
MMVRLAAIMLCVMACGPVVGVTGSETGGGETEGSEGTAATSMPGTSSPTTLGTSTSTTTTTTTITTTTDSSSGGEDESTSAPSCAFLCPPDFVSPIECDVWEQDCPAGEKCMPWANDGGNSFNATKCTAIVDDPAQPGDPCTVEGSGVSGIDSCDAAAMCWNVHPDTLEGTCVAFCGGSEDNPFCFDECQFCTATGESLLNLCLPVCDPLVQDCGEHSGCYDWGENFGCAVDPSGAGGGAGEPCEFINACDAGTMCVAADAMPDCEDVGCCAPFCTVGDDTPCAAVPGTACVPLFEDHVPSCVSPNVGACMLPP